jgi:hypothetical protein
MKAVCVALLLACAIGAVLSADVHRVLRASKQRTLSAAASRAESRATLDALVAANSQLLVPVVTLAKEVGIEDAALTALMQTVAVRNARFEVRRNVLATHSHHHFLASRLHQVYTEPPFNLACSLVLIWRSGLGCDGFGREP